MKLIQKELKTERLTLSRPYMTDVEDFYAALSDGEIFRYNAWNKHDNALETLAFLNNLMIRWDNGATEWTVRKNDGDTAIGIVCVRYYPKEEDAAEIGFWLSAAEHKKGYGRESVEAAVKYIFENCGVKKMVAFCHPKNIASLKILEKCGFSVEGEIKNDFSGEDFEPTDVILKLSAFN